MAVPDLPHALLDVPIRSRGRLVFAPPDKLLRRVDSPFSSEVVIDGDRVEVRSEGEVQRIDLASQPDLQPLVQSILWVLAGDRESIDRAYQPSFETTSTGWFLQLTPRDPRVAALIAGMRLEGARGVPVSLHVIETSGDRSHTRFIAPEIDCRLTASDRAELFEPERP